MALFYEEGWYKDTQYGMGDGVDRTHSAIDPGFKPTALWHAENCVYTQDSNDPEAMYGSTQLGTTAMGGAVSGMFDYNNGDKLVATATDGKVYVYGSDWAASTGAQATGHDTTATTRWSGGMFYGATTTKNLLVISNGIDAPIRYDTTNGAVTLGGTPPAAGKYGVPWRGRWWMASGDTLLGSTTNNVEDWTTDGVSLSVARGNDGNITGLAPFAGSLFIFKRSSIYRIPPLATIAEASVRDISNNIGCVSHHTIKEAGAGNTFLIFRTEHGLSGLTPSGTHTGFSIMNVGQPIKPILDRQNSGSMAISWSDFNINRMEYYHFHPTSAATVPKYGFIGNFGRQRGGMRWTTTNYPNLTAGVTFNTSNTGYDQYVGDTLGRVFKLHDTTVTTRGGASFTSKIITRSYAQGRPWRMKHYGYSFIEAETNSADTVSVRLNMIRRGLPAATANVGVFDPDAAESDWGVGQWGVALWGGGGSAGKLIRPSSVGRGSAMRHIIESTGWFKLIGATVASNLAADNIAA